MIRIAAISVVFTASIASAQTPVSDSAVANSSAVTTFAVRSGKLALSSASNTKPVFVPDGTYTNEAGTIIVVLEGRITRIQKESGEITEISGTRVNRHGVVAVMPSTSGLNTVTEFTLPSGTFKSEDGRSSFTIVVGRPTVFSFR